MYIYLDESGDLGFDFENKDPSPYFAISVLVCASKREIFSFKAAVKRTLVAKFNNKKQKKLVSELKGINTTTEVKRFFYKQLAKRPDQDWNLYSIVLDKKQFLARLSIPVSPHRLYNQLTREILERVNFSGLSENVLLIVDKCKGGSERAIFDSYLKANLETKLPIDINLSISHELSHNNAGLQAVDLFCHGIIRKHALNDLSWYSVFSDRIIEEVRWMPNLEQKKDGAR